VGLENEGWNMNRNYKLQNTNYKQITNYNVPNYKQKKGGMVIGEQGRYGELRGLKASIPCMPTNSHELYNIGHFDAFPP
jgi:hypothetical protein